VVLSLIAKKLAMLIPQIRSFIFTVHSQFIILYTVTQVQAITVISYLFLFAAIMNKQKEQSQWFHDVVYKKMKIATKSAVLIKGPKDRQYHPGIHRCPTYASTSEI